MEEKNLENIVTREHLQEHGFRCKGKRMYRIIHDQEIVFIEVMTNCYIFDGIYPVKKRIGS